MLKKTFALTALAALAVFWVPTAASAVSYVPGGEVVVTVSGVPDPGATVTVTAERGSFPNDSSADIVMSGTTAARMGTAAEPQGAVNGTGSVSFSVVLPAGAAGAQTATITGGQTGRSGSAVITVIPGDAVAASTGTTQLGTTGYSTPVGVIGVASAALLLGIAITVLTVLKRRRTTA